jgi:hypothetical protein
MRIRATAAYGFTSYNGINGIFPLPDADIIWCIHEIPSAG